jgi:hypothetical protein
LCGLKVLLAFQVQLASEEETLDLEKLQARISDIVQDHRRRLHMQMLNSVSKLYVMCLLQWLVTALI